MKPNRSLAFVAVVAFLLHVMLPFFAMYGDVQEAALARQQASSSQELAALFGETVLICTGDGFKWVRWEDVQSGKERPDPHPQYKCPLCYVAAHGLTHALPGNAAALATLSGLPAAGGLFVADEPSESAAFLRRHPVRAPPVSIIA